MITKHILPVIVVFIVCLNISIELTFTNKELHQLYKISAPAVSSDKKYAVFQSKKWNFETKKTANNLVYVDIQSENPTPKNLTIPIEGQSDTTPSFSPSFPNHIFFLRRKEQRTHIYYMSFPPKADNPEEPVKLTDYPLDVANLRINQNKLMFSTDMHITCPVMKCTSEKLEAIKKRGENTYQEYTSLMVRHWDFWYKQGINSHPFYQNIKLNDDGKIVLDGDPFDCLLHISAASPPIENGNEQFSISSNGKYVAFSVHIVNHEMSWTTKWDIFLMNTDNNDKKILTSTEVGRCQNPKFSNDGKKLAYLCMSRKGLENDAFQLRIYDIEKGELLTPGSSEVFVPSINDYIWDDDSNNVFIYSTTDRGHITLYRYNFDATKTPYTRLTKDDNGYGIPIKVDTNTYIVTYIRWDHFDVLSQVKYDEETQKSSVKVLADLNKEKFDQFTLSKGESFEFIGANNDTVQGWIFEPINRVEGKKYPCILLIHGGPEQCWRPAMSVSWSPQHWTNHGYAVVMINIHGSMGMGNEFMDAVRNSWGGIPFQDLILGVKYVNKTYSSFIDIDRLGAAGASYGGYMVNWIQGNNDDGLFKCLVTHDGVFSTITMFYGTEEMWFPMSEYCPHDKLGCKPYEGPEARKGYEAYNPEMRVDHWKTPHYIIHGALDYRIPISEAISAFSALQMRGVPSKFLYFPTENHWVLDPSNSITWFDEVLAFQDKYLGN